MDTCFFCKGDMEPALTKFIVDLDDVVVIVKNVPAMVCTQCGEKSFDDATMERLEEIVNKVREGFVTEVAIVEYTKAA
ncbi:MAG: YgiT-type zinc finger protein [Oscillospiraceae bacterium]|nr:YgiT-type zinc finger protein [Oscillospiraceae bacterium]